MQKEKHSEIWETYSDSWSEPNESIRESILQKMLFENCSYTDVNIETHNIIELSAYMAEFQSRYLGARFKTTNFIVHHDQSLTHWNMVDRSGKTLTKGASFGLYEAEKLKKMAGFFWD
ncbi:MAG: cell division FtsA domain-containing protein [Flammeovirgaceae bacterium]|jgi:hypothetical protein|nr:cell division FtsA domain-containing protein [Flammeovirgaceae bacterium]